MAHGCCSACSRPRAHAFVCAAGVKPVTIELTDFKTKKVVDVLEVDACMVATGRAPYTNGLNLGAINAETDKRGFVPVNDMMQVVDKAGKALPHVYCIGDANGKYMLAHAASAQGISAVENMCGRPHVLNHLSIPAACFTHPEVSFVGVTQEKAEEMAKEKGFPLGISKTSFKANSKVGINACGRPHAATGRARARAVHPWVHACMDGAGEPAPPLPACAHELMQAQAGRIRPGSWRNARMLTTSQLACAR